MKKIISVLVLIVMLFTMSGCYSNNNNAEDILVPQESENQNQEITLTTDNIYDYLLFTTKTEAEVDNWEYDRHCYLGEGVVSVKVSPKKRGDFNGVILNVTLTTTSKGWIGKDDWESRKKEFAITIDGEFEEEYDVSSSILGLGEIAHYPEFEIVVNSVTGTFMPNS